MFTKFFKRNKIEEQLGICISDDLTLKVLFAIIPRKDKKILRSFLKDDKIIFNIKSNVSDEESWHEFIQKSINSSVNFHKPCNKTCKISVKTYRNGKMTYENTHIAASSKEDLYIYFKYFHEALEADIIWISFTNLINSQETKQMIIMRY